MRGDPPSTGAKDPATETRPARTGFHAFLVASGILLSRITGLVRQRVFAHYFGAGAAADAFSAAFRIPNFLQNLFGEGVLSASFIPVYASLLARGDEKAADRLAAAVFGLLAVLVSGLVLAGFLATPYLVDLVAPGFEGETRALTVRLVRILFPGAGLLVLSAWCLGVLNSHRKFFISYTAPVLWNGAMIATLLVFGGRRTSSLAAILAWGSVAGSLLQLGIQVPFVRRAAPHLFAPGGIGLNVGTHVRTVLRNFGPVFVGRGVVQISAYVDALLASLLPTGSVAALVYAQILYTLPVSLFGMSVAAAELPAMSGALGEEEAVAAQLCRRLDAGLARIAFFVVPSAVAFLALGEVLAAALYQTGSFTRGDAVWVWGILAGYGLGLLATTSARLYASTFYALQDTRTPLRFAVVRVVLVVGLGYLFALPLPRLLGIDPRWGVAGLSLAASMAGWVEYSLLRHSLGQRIGRAGLPARAMVALWGSALLAAALARGIGRIAPSQPVLAALVILIPYGLIYVAVTATTGVGEARSLLSRVARLLQHH